MPGDGMPPKSVPEAGQRLFFALWPDASVVYALGEAVSRVQGGRLSRPETLHLTLAFLGEVDGDRLAELDRIAGAADSKGFTWTVTYLGYWRHNRILWAGGAAPPALLELVEHLRKGLAAAGFSLSDAGRRFVPHVTLARRTPEPPAKLPEMVPIRWDCREFVLVRSKLSSRGAGYEIIGRWPLPNPG